MPKTVIRFSKSLVLAEIKNHRARIRELCAVDMDIHAEYAKFFPREPLCLSRDEKLRSLLMMSTFHLTNVLQLE